MTKFLPVAAAGLLMQAELAHLGQLLSTPDRPYMAILGGAKVSDKIGLIFNLLPKLNRVLIGGGMAYTFLVAQGVQVGNSLVEADKVDAARDIFTRAAALGVIIQLPEDHVIAERLDASAATRRVPQRWYPIRMDGCGHWAADG